MKRIISIWILLLCAGISKVQAQNDATLAGMILVYTNKAEKELKNQEKVMLMQTTGHVWTKEEVEGTTDLQREFNNYLNSFRSIVCYAAQIYGFYHEISQLTDNMGDFHQTIEQTFDGCIGCRPLHAAQPDLPGDDIEQRGDCERHPHGLPVGQQDDGKGTYGDRVRHTSETPVDEPDAATAD